MSSNVAADSGTLAGQSPGAFAPAAGSTAYVAKAGDTMTGALNLPANGLAVGGSQLVTSGGNVGIGTPSPINRLSVSGDADFNNISLNGYNWSVTTSGDPHWGFGVFNSGANCGEALNEANR